MSGHLGPRCGCIASPLPWEVAPMSRRAHRTIRLWQIVALVILAIAALPVAPPTEPALHNPLGAESALAQSGIVLDMDSAVTVTLSADGWDNLCNDQFGLMSPTTNAFWSLNPPPPAGTSYALGTYPA